MSVQLVAILSITFEVNLFQKVAILGHCLEANVSELTAARHFERDQFWTSQPKCSQASVGELGAIADAQVAEFGTVGGQGE